MPKRDLRKCNEVNEAVNKGRHLRGALDDTVDGRKQTVQTLGRPPYYVDPLLPSSQSIVPPELPATTTTQLLLFNAMTWRDV
jgi:hypothetical protein